MFINNKKAENSVIKTIVILLITTTIFLSFTLVLFKANSYTIDDKKLQTQIVVSKIFNSKCFSDEYGIINENKFTQEQFNKCFKNIQTNIAFQIKIDNSKTETIAINKETFDNKIGLCSVPSNILCTDIIYPITLKNTYSDTKQANMHLQIITN